MDTDKPREFNDSDDRAGSSARVFLFLQGPISPFFPKIAAALESRGHQIRRINLCFGDRLVWRRPGAVNYRGTAENWPQFIASFLDREAVSDLVLLGEQRFYQRAAIAAARLRGIQVTVTDFGYLRPDWITLEPEGMSGESRFPRDADGIRVLARLAPPVDPKVRYADSFAAQACWDVIYHLANSLFRVLYPHYVSYQLHHPALAYIGTGWRLLMRKRRSKRASTLIRSLKQGKLAFYVFPMQMENDFQLRAYSPYPDLTTPIREVIGSFSRSAPAGSHLIIKVHPLDPGLRPWSKIVARVAAAHSTHQRVHYIDGGSLDALMESAQGVVTINSTVGVWALRSGRPLKVLGDAIYDIPELAYQGSLDNFWVDASAPSPELVADFVRALANTIQIRGVYYAQPGLDAAVAAAAEKLHAQSVDAWMSAMSRPSQSLRSFARGGDDWVSVPTPGWLNPLSESSYSAEDPSGPLGAPAQARVMLPPGC